MMSSTQQSALLDALYDLQHDLGKHLRMPLAFLPADATADQIRETLQRALLATRSGPTGSRSAWQIWQQFVNELSTVDRALPRFASLAEAVETALAWEEMISAEQAIDRQAVLRDFDSVAEAIRAFIDDVEGG